MQINPASGKLPSLAFGKSASASAIGHSSLTSSNPNDAPQDRFELSSPQSGKKPTKSQVAFSGRSDLHDAAALGETSEIRELLQGADEDYLNEQDEDGNTALHLAAMEGKQAAVRVLLGKPGIEPSITNDDGETALDLANAQGHGAVAKLLANKMGIRNSVQMSSGGTFIPSEYY